MSKLPVYVKQCPKCGGALQERCDQWGSWISCINCSYELSRAEEISFGKMTYPRLPFTHLIGQMNPRLKKLREIETLLSRAKR